MFFLITVCPQALEIVAIISAKPLATPFTVTWLCVPPLTVATAVLLLLQVTVLPAPRLLMIQTTLFDGQIAVFPVIVAELEIGALDTEQLMLGLATPFIDGTTETFEGKIVPETGCKVREFEVELITFQPG